jgi:lipid II:glycine glycyltransferase (peptidoglycan interpeptide bridge formation enzyme)
MKVEAPDFWREIDSSTTFQLSTSVTETLSDPRWDAFVERAPGGSHIQTSLWGQVKASSGWHVRRLVIEHQGNIVGGAQFLLRKVPVLGYVGYVSHGPLLAANDPRLGAHVIREMKRTAAQERIRFLIVQPPHGNEALGQHLQEWGFQPGTTAVAPTATVLVDLTATEDEILAQMRQKTRQNIRSAQKKGMIAREGSEEDLDTFYQLLEVASERRGFSPEPPDFYKELCRVMEPAGYLKIFLAEHEGETISSLVITPFGDTVVCKRGAWSGKQPGLHPNHFIFWSVMRWGKANGYRYCDLDGIERERAVDILDGNNLHAERKYSTDDFKTQFGGEVRLLPGPLEYVPNPLLRWLYNGVVKRALKARTLKDLSNKVRVS